MSKTTETAVTIGISEDNLHETVKALGQCAEAPGFLQPRPKPDVGRCAQNKSESRSGSAEKTD